MNSSLRRLSNHCIGVLSGFMLLLTATASPGQLNMTWDGKSLASKLGDELLTQTILRHNGRVAIIPETAATRGIAGRWDRASRTLFIYLNQTSTYEDYKEVLRHEAVHMAQFCNGTRMGLSGPVPIGAIISDPAKASYSFGREEGLYNDSQDLLESEAYTMEKADDQEIISLLELQCRDRDR